MEKTRKILNISIALSIVLCSLSIFIYSLNYKTATAKPVNTMLDNDYKLAGIVDDGPHSDGTFVKVIGYNETSGEIKVMAQGIVPYH